MANLDDVLARLGADHRVDPERVTDRALAALARAPSPKRAAGRDSVVAISACASVALLAGWALGGLQPAAAPGASPLGAAYAHSAAARLGS